MHNFEQVSGSKIRGLCTIEKLKVPSLFLLSKRSSFRFSAQQFTGTEIVMFIKITNSFETDVTNLKYLLNVKAEHMY